MYRTYCGCGNSTIYTTNSSETNCPMKCSGNNQQACGGNPYYSVYYLGKLFYLVNLASQNRFVDLG